MLMTKIGWSDFVIWQCSLRQRNFRMFGGKPSEGTIASFSNIKLDIQLGDIRSILMEANCEDTSKMFEFMHKQTHDPETRFDKAIKFFSSEYYNTPSNFDGSFTATFPYQSNVSKDLLKKDLSVLEVKIRKYAHNFQLSHQCNVVICYFCHLSLFFANSHF